MKKTDCAHMKALIITVTSAALFCILPSVLWAKSNGPGAPSSIYAVPYAHVIAGNLDVNQNPLFEEFGAVLGYSSRHFEANANAMLLNDGLYSQQEPIPGGYRIQLNNGDIALKLKPFELKGGLMTHTDEVRSPYSLFFNPNGFPTTGLNFDFSQGIFFYKTEWLQLNHLSSLYKDRGMNYKVYGVKLGHLRLGFQDVVLYLDRSFSANFFLNPIPMYVTQLVSVQGAGNPWVQNTNDNTLMGFFGDYTAPKWYGYAQVLIDDLSLTVFTPWIHKYVHPWKVAWSFGGTYDFPFGTLGFYQGGASKYTFEPTYQTTSTPNEYPYQYTFYPGDQQPSPPNGTGLPIPYDNNYIGYQYGENNLAFMVTYKKEIQNYRVGGDVEYRISGSKSPNNPWGNLTGPPTTYWAMFDHAPLEQRILVAGYAQRPFGRLTVSFGATLGYVLHELQLTAATDGGPALFAPSNTNRFLYQFDLGVSYKLSMKTSKPKR